MSRDSQTPSPYGPNNPHPLSNRKTELVWEGKYDEYGNRRTVHLPDFPTVMQRIETIDAPRDETVAQGRLFDSEKSHCDDFRNRLVWGDNKLILSSLLQEFRGKVDLVYIDPPFDVGADFTMNIALGDDGGEVHKEQSVLEAVAYRDMWGKNTDSYLHMMYERLYLIKALLSDNGSIYVHCDYRVSSMIRLLLDDVFGTNRFRNEIIWCYTGPGSPGMKQYNRKHDAIYWYSKSENDFKFIDKNIRIQHHEKTSANFKAGLKGSGFIGENYDLPEGKIPEDWWEMAIAARFPVDGIRRVGYPTEKPWALIERIINTNTEEGDLVLDCFCGSGTTLAVAEKLGRRWIGCDLGRYAIHTTRKRMIGVQRELHAAEKPYRSFDVYNLGRYERQWWQMERLRGADEEHRATVLKFFRAQPIANAPSPLLHATKGRAYVHVDSIDSILTRTELETVARAAHAVGAPELVCLAWEFEMNLRQHAVSLSKELGLQIGLKYIPREIMEANRNDVRFYDAAALEAKAIVKKGAKPSVDVELQSFLPSLAEVNDKEMEALRARAIASPFDFIDFWAIDFEWREDKPFEHHWQEFRTRKDRSLLTTSNCAYSYATPGNKHICVKVIDVFGVDTTTVIEARV